MSAPDALNEAIRAFPDEDTPRLAYADYLDEHDQSVRAEFIRAQIELSRLPYDDPRRAALTARERRLLLAHGAEWVPGGGEATFHFHRGFVEKVSAPLVQFLALADELHERHPVRSVELWRDRKKVGKRKAAQTLAALAGHPVWSRVRSLTVGRCTRGNPCDLSDTLALCASPHLTGLRHLDVGDMLGPDKANEFLALLRLPALQHLIEFNAAWVQLPGDVLFEFFAPQLPDLRRLCLGQSNVEPGTAERFCREAAARKWDFTMWDESWGRPLADIRLENVRAGAVRSLVVRSGEFFDRLLELPDWGGLRELRLDWYPGLSPGWGDRLAAHPGLANLADLQLYGQGLHDPPPVGLFHSPLLTNLTRLTIHCPDGDGPGFTAAFVDGLDRPGVLPKVRDFFCRTGRFWQDTLKKFLASRFVTGLRALRIDDEYMTAEEAAQFARCDNLTGLNELELRSGERGRPELMRAFAAPERFPLLYKLHVSHRCGSVPDDVVEAVLTPGWLTDVYGSWYTDRQARRFLESREWDRTSGRKTLESAD